MAIGMVRDGVTIDGRESGRDICPVLSIFAAGPDVRRRRMVSFGERTWNGLPEWSFLVGFSCPIGVEISDLIF